MTDQKTIDKATRIIFDTWTDEDEYDPETIARALADAGLLNPWSSVEEEQVRAEKAEADRDALAATVQRVRDLANGWYQGNSWNRAAARRIDTALDDPQEQSHEA